MKGIMIYWTGTQPVGIWWNGNKNKTHNQNIMNTKKYTKSPPHTLYIYRYICIYIYLLYVCIYIHINTYIYVHLFIYLFILSLFLWPLYDTYSYYLVFDWCSVFLGCCSNKAKLLQVFVFESLVFSKSYIYTDVPQFSAKYFRHV